MDLDSCGSASTDEESEAEGSDSSKAKGGLDNEVADVAASADAQRRRYRTNISERCRKILRTCFRKGEQFLKRRMESAGSRSEAQGTRGTSEPHPEVEGGDDGVSHPAVAEAAATCAAAPAVKPHRSEDGDQAEGNLAQGWAREHSTITACR